MTPDADAIEMGVQVLQAGHCLGVPTETVYGLAGVATDPVTVARIFAIKQRPAINPLICHVSSVEMAMALVRFTPAAQTLAEAFWPGPLTLVLTKRPDCPLPALVSAGQDTLAIRMPAHPVMLALIDGIGLPLAAPSANRSGAISPTRAEHVAAGLDGRIPLILDGGPCRDGLESTIISATGRQLNLLRPGPVTPELVLEHTGLTVNAAPPPVAANDAPLRAPGQMSSHYAPDKPVRMNARTASRDEFHIGFGAIPGDATLSASADLQEAAEQLFHLLHVADQSDRQAIAVAPVPADGVGAAVNDRLRRAAAPRPARPGSQ